MSVSNSSLETVAPPIAKGVFDTRSISQCLGSKPSGENSKVKVAEVTRCLAKVDGGWTSSITVASMADTEMSSNFMFNEVLVLFRSPRSKEPCTACMVGRFWIESRSWGSNLKLTLLTSTIAG
ncbi:Uncharacterized protein HZ326_4033 [Fusarium oxysporum f. sp. albedinis]|nr:Uncharacterized protein HZ326_4033 [Fusarium oxysporum f. sp. albedinis]